MAIDCIRSASDSEAEQQCLSVLTDRGPRRAKKGELNMFTGLVEMTGVIAGRDISGGSGKFKVRPERKLENPVYGESIAVNGVCLTLEEESGGLLVFHTLEETLKRTNLGALPIGAEVNLERAMELGGRMGGHLVQGHVDAVGKILGIEKSGSDIELSVEAPEELHPYMIKKGSITIDGISLTIVKLEPDHFTVHLIPVTWADTALKNRKSGDYVNLEGDLIGKYVERQFLLKNDGKTPSSVDMETLRKAGW